MVPKGRHNAQCFHCHHLIDKSEARTRARTAGSKVYHIQWTPYKTNGFATLTDMLSESNEFCEGWDTLGESAKKFAKKITDLNHANPATEHYMLDEEATAAADVPLPSVCLPTTSA